MIWPGSKRMLCFTAFIYYENTNMYQGFSLSLLILHHWSQYLAKYQSNNPIKPPEGTIYFLRYHHIWIFGFGLAEWLCSWTPTLLENKKANIPDFLLEVDDHPDAPLGDDASISNNNNKATIWSSSCDMNFFSLWLVLSIHISCGRVFNWVAQLVSH